MSEWIAYKLGEVCSRLSSGSNITAKDIHESGSFPVFGGNGIRGYAAEANFSGECAIIGRQGAYCGNVRYFKGEARMSEHAIVACAGASHNTRFLAYLLSNMNLGSLSGQAAQPGLSVKVLAQQSVRMPPARTQERVASILGAYDDLIEVNRRRVSVLEEMARGLFEEWFVRFRFPGHEDVPLIDTQDGPLPEGWDWGRFSNLISEVRQTIDPSRAAIETPYVGLEHLPRRSTTLREHGLAGDVESTKACFQRGDILFGKIRPYFHKVVWAPFDGIASTDAIVWRPDPRFAARALAIASSDPFVAHSVQTSNGTKMPRANAAVLRNYRCAMPSAHLSQMFEQTMQPVVELAAALQAASGRLATSRDLLLPRLISGQLTIECAERELEEAA